MNILYPHRVDLNRAISTMYRELGSRMNHQIHGFVGPETPPDRVSDIVTYQLTSNDSPIAVLKHYIHLDHFDLIHTGPRLHNLLAAGYAALTETGIVHTVHNVREQFDPSIPLLVRRRLMTIHPDYVVAPSTFISQNLERLYGRKPHIIPNGVDLDRFRPDIQPTEPDTCLFVGRFEYGKNPKFLIDIARTMPDLQFIMCGWGRKDALVRRRAEQLENLTVKGHVSHDTLSKLFSRAAITLCPFENEGFGMVAVESLASGTPVIALADGHLPSLVSEDAGMLCNSLSVNEWAETIRTTCEKYNNFSPRTVVEPYSWDQTVKLYSDVYERTVATP